MLTYGVQIEPQFGYSFEEIKQIVQTAENNKFTHAWFSDHFLLQADSTDLECQECFTAMMAAASYTSTLRIGPLVLCNNYRHPAVLAKQFAGLDHFSKGRMEFGYGTGWKELEYNAYGIVFPEGKVRMAQFIEALQVIKKLWTEDFLNFEGKYYSLKEAVSFPKPYQKPYPTIWIGVGGGKRKILDVTAQYGEGINFVWAISPEDLKERLDTFDGFVEKYDRKPKEIKRSYGAFTSIYPDEESKKKEMKKMAEERKISLEEMEKRMESTLHGTVEEIIDRIKSYEKIGIEHIIFMFPHEQEIKQLKDFAEKIMPKI